MILFYKIIPKKAQRSYIIYSDIMRHYGERVLTSQIDTVMADYGQARRKYNF